MRVLTSILLPLLLAACGGTNHGHTVEHRPPPDAKDGEGQYAGRLDAADVRRVIEQHHGGFDNCFRRGTATYLSGQVYVEFAVGGDGRVEHAQVARSDLGSWVVEDCLVEAAQFLEFPRPAGGRARFAYPFSGRDVGRRMVSKADPAWGYKTLRSARRPINTCRARYGYQGPFHVTVYVGALGAVLDVGFDASERAAREFSACIVHTVRGLKFPAPRSGQMLKYRALVENLDDDA